MEKKNCKMKNGLGKIKIIKSHTNNTYTKIFNSNVKVFIERVKYVHLYACK